MIRWADSPDLDPGPMGPHDLSLGQADVARLAGKGPGAAGAGAGSGLSSPTSIKPAKMSKRSAKRTNSGSMASHHSMDSMVPLHIDGRSRRVWKACERCRMKKTKCDGEFPCKRCIDDSVICTAGPRKKVQYKTIPKGYAEVLEHTTLALAATCHKLYSMIRQSEPWTLDDPGLNSRGQPVIHRIADLLGCIRAFSDTDLPIRSSFPVDEEGMADLALQLEEREAQAKQRQRQQQQRQQSSAGSSRDPNEVSDEEFQCFSDSDADGGFASHAYSTGAFGSGGSASVAISPHSQGAMNDYELSPTMDRAPRTHFGTGPQDQAFQGWSTLHMAHQVQHAQHQHRQHQQQHQQQQSKQQHQQHQQRQSHLQQHQQQQQQQHQQSQQVLQHQQPKDGLMPDGLYSDGMNFMSSLNQEIMGNNFGIEPNILSIPNADSMAPMADTMFFNVDEPVMPTT